MTAMKSTELADLQFMTVEAISRETRIPARKVRQLINTGFFPRAKIPGRLLLVRRSDVEKALGAAQDRV